MGMRWRVFGSGLVLAAALAIPLASRAAADPPSSTVPAAGASKPAVRMAPMQVTPTLPPPATLPTAPGDSLDVPANSGSGRRIVYSKTIMRVWLLEADGALYQSHRVSGLDSMPDPGTYAVFSRSEFTCSRNHSNICMRYMVRFARSWRGDNIGFHEIPRQNGIPMQTISELGLAISGGCVRQATDDAIVTWNWAQLGTVVVVLA